MPFLVFTRVCLIALDLLFPECPEFSKTKRQSKSYGHKRNKGIYLPMCNFLIRLYNKTIVTNVSKFLFL